MLGAATQEAIHRSAAAAPGLELLILHGSRARGDHRPGSDWDFAYLADPDFDPAGFAGTLSLALGTDHLDLADLARATGLLRFRAARDGALFYERLRGTFDEFRVQAASFWCEAGPFIRDGYEAVLQGLDR